MIGTWVCFALLCILSPAVNAQQPLTILNAVYSGGNVQRDVTPFLSKQVRGGQVQFDVGNHTLGGDPYFGKTKTLTVLYRIASGDFTITANEGERLVIPNSKAVRVAPANQILATQTPSSSSSQTSPVAIEQPASRRLAPDGIYYLLQRTSVSTDSGIASIPPGTRVERVGESDGKLKVKAGEQEFEIEKSLLTNDLDIATATASQDSQRLAAVRLKVQEGQMQLQKIRDRGVAQTKASEKAKELHIEINQVISGGVLADPLNKEYTEVVGNSTGNGGGTSGGGVYYERSWKVIFVQGITGVAEGKQMTIKAYEDGTYTYSDTRGASRTVDKWVLVQ